MNGRNIILIGGSAGAFDPLQGILAALPRDFPAAIFVVLHVGSRPITGLLSALAHSTRLNCALAADGAPISQGAVVIAPPDHHLIIRADAVRLSRGPRENLWRPAIDVLFRSAAVTHGSRVISVLLSGALDDGTAGTDAVRRCGGATIAQSPDDARSPDMPQSAIRSGLIDHITDSADIPALLSRLVAEGPVPAPQTPRDLVLEAQIAESGASTAALNEELGELSDMSCSDCGGPLWKRHGNVLRYRCLVGHAHTARALDEGSAHSLDAALWAAIRQFEQRANLYVTMAAGEQARGRTRSATNYRDREQETRKYASTLRTMLMHSSATAHSSEASPVPIESAAW